MPSLTPKCDTVLRAIQRFDGDSLPKHIRIEFHPEFWYDTMLENGEARTNLFQSSEGGEPLFAEYRYELNPDLEFGFVLKPRE